MKDLILFRDCFNPRLLNIDEEFKTFDDNLTSNKKGIKVVFEATHSGMFNNNLRLYIPSLMRDGTKSFVDRKKPAKILKHHKADADPVGIITGAEYIETIPEGLKDNKDVQILVDSTSTLKQKVKAAKNFLKTGIPMSEDFKGLGYIKLYGYVTDKIAIEQLEDKRFDAVSTSFTSPSGVLCSECTQNLVLDGPCEHVPGERYEDDDGDSTVCALIPAVHNYRECSLVVFDADPFTVVEIVKDSETIDKQVYNLNVDKLKDSDANFERFAYELKDSEEDGMAKPKPLSDKQKKVLGGIKQLRPDLEDKTAIGYAIKIASVQDDKGKFPDQDLAEIDDKTALQYELEAIEGTDELVNADEVYSSMEEFLIADNRLTSEARKKLSDSIFCGPNRSFPAPDSAHVIAVEEVLKAYNGPGNKTSILASLNRKKKAFGSQDSDIGKDDLGVEDFILPTGENLKSLSDKEMQILFSMLETALIDRKLKVCRDCSKCAEAADRLEVFTKEKEEAVDKLDDAEKRLSALRYEYRLQMKDYETQVDKNIELSDVLGEEKLDKLTLVSVLLGQHKDKETAIEAFRDSEILDLEKTVLKDFDLEKAALKLNDGMDHVPEGIVPNPVLEDEDGQTQKFDLDKLGTTGKNAITNMKKFVSEGKMDRAVSLYTSMINCDVFPDSLKFDDLVEDKTTD